MEVPAKLRSTLTGIRSYLVALLFLAVATSLAACGGGETTTVTMISEDIGTIVLTIEEPSLVVGGNTTRVGAAVSTFDGEPVKDGTIVTFTVDPIGGFPGVAYAQDGTAIEFLSAETTTTTKEGIAIALLTSDTAAGEYYITASAGNVKTVALGEFVAGPADEANTILSANPNSIEADGASTSRITLVAKDAYGNPVEEGTEVNFYLSSNGGTLDPGTLSSITETTENGIAITELSSSENDDTITTVTAIVGPITTTALVGLGTVVGDGTGSGNATNILVEIIKNRIRVKNSGGDETTIIKATAIDESGSPVTDCGPENNIRFEIINGPGGGEKLDGNDTVSDKFTVNGLATSSLSSGTVSGTVNVQVSVLLNGDCKDADLPDEGYYATAYSTQIAIEAGEPANITMFEDTTVTDNNDGSISKTFSALAQDLHGNPVENGTVIYFGLVDNPDAGGPPYLGYKVAGSSGRTYGNATFTGSNFSDLQDDDILIILEGIDRGGHRIKSVDNSTTLTLYNMLKSTETGLRYVAGSAELGTVCGSVQTGNLEMEPSCTPTEVGGVGSIKGVAHTKLTWTPQAIFKPFHMYTESVGGYIGDTFANSYFAIAPVTVTVNIVPGSVASEFGGSNLTVEALVRDGSDHRIQGELVTVISGDVSKAKFGSANSDSAITDINGFASVSTLDVIPYDEGDPDEEGDESGCGPGDNITITASIGGYSGTATVSCQ